MVKTYPMCRKSIDCWPIPRGTQTQFFPWRVVVFLLPFIILASLPLCESRASETLGSQRLISNEQIRKVYREDTYSNYIKDDWQQGNLYVGRSGDPWGTMSMKQQEEHIYVHISPSINSTYNNTKNSQLSTNDEKSISHARLKRGVVHLYNMVVCATGCNPLSYKGYGCYCGFLGSGYVIDGIDRCCKMHDWCYDATECAMFSEYFVPYYWRCYHGYKPICAVEHGSWGGSGSCAQRLCECDRSLAECLRHFPCPTTKAVCTSSPWRLVQNLFMIM